MVTLICSNADTGQVRRRAYASFDSAREACDALIDAFYRRRGRGRRPPGRPGGPVWDPGTKGSRHPYRFELTGGGDVRVDH
jgi:hypothetical protein